MIGILVLTAVALVYAGTAGHEFVAYDDDRYVYANPIVTGGMSAEGIGRAFNQSSFGAWYPATALSHMLVWEAFGDDPAWHHLLNVALHAANCLLVLVLFQRLTGERILAATVALLFAVHPLHVESVAWVTERKGVLSSFFGLLAILTYVRFARRAVFESSTRTAWTYALMFVLFALCAMAKTALVTLPFLLLVLDYWPLERTRAPSERAPRALRLVLEKLPLLCVSLIFSLATLSAHQVGGAVAKPTDIPLLWRVLDIPINYLAYLGKAIWPTGLACFYPHPALVGPAGAAGGMEPEAVEQVRQHAIGAALAFAVLTAISWAAFVGRRKRPWLLVGWLWYLGMLVPVSGIVQVSFAATADRFVYFPMIGIYLIVAGAGLELARLLPSLQRVLALAAVAALLGLGFLAWQQVAVWRDSESLFRHALAETDRNAFAHSNLGVVLFQAGEATGAERQFRAAIAIDSSLPQYHHNLGFALAVQGRLRPAVDSYRRALRIVPRDFDGNYQLGNALLQLGDYEGAIRHYQRALQARPRHAEVLSNLGQARSRLHSTQRP